MPLSHYEKYRKKRIIEIDASKLPDTLPESDYPKQDSLNSNNSRELSIKIHWPIFYAYLNLHYPSSVFEWREKIWCFYHNIIERPVCKACGQPVKFHNGKGYAEYCSQKCANNSDLKKQKIEQIKLERYGDAHYVNQEKREKTKLERYGDKNYNNRKKALDTILENGGEGFGNANKAAYEKQKQTTLERYGVDNILKDKDIHQKTTNRRNAHIKETAAKISESLHNRFKKTNPNLIDSEGYGIWKCKCPHPDSCNKCQEKWYIMDVRQMYYRSKHNMEMCTTLLPIQSDLNTGTSIELFIRDILDEYNIEYECNNRTILKGKELDIYIPSKRLAIECNGIYWHSTLQKTQLYHYYKWKCCKEQGIQLLTFWEDQIAHKTDIVKSILLAKLGIIPNKIGARKCEIREISNEEAFNFYQYNHIQGGTQGKVNIGLYHCDELIGTMSFGHHRYSQSPTQQNWELIRFCTKLNTQITGGASKIFKYFTEHYNPNTIISFSSNDISNGELYKQLGFHYDNTSHSTYWYIHSRSLERFHRSTFTKNAIVKRGWKDAKDNSWTELEVMTNRGYLQIYDTGQQKWIWANTQKRD